MTIGSLFSGIGGLELGLEWAGLGPTLWQVEKDPKCRAVLAKHWPEAERYDDVCTVGGSTLARVDLICGGFPCQDVSSAGKRAGLAGARSGLWHEFARIVGECRPRWVVIENVRSGARKYVDAVRGELGRLGYASLPIPIGASDCGAPHERARIFILARAVADSVCERRAEGVRSEPSRAAPEVSASECAGLASPHADGVEQRLAAARRCGGTSREGSSGTAVALADADCVRQPQPQGGESNVGRWPCDSGRIWTAEPDVARVVHGLSGRVDRERMLGNSVVPQCAEVIGHVIQRLERGAA